MREWPFLPCLLNDPPTLPLLSVPTVRSTVHSVPSARVAERCVASVPCFSQARSQPFPHPPHSASSVGHYSSFLCSDASPLSDQVPHPSLYYSSSFSSTAQDPALQLLDWVPSSPSPSEQLRSPSVPRSKAGIASRSKSRRSYTRLMAFPFLPGSNLQRVLLQKCSSPLCVRERERREGGRESTTTVWQRAAALESC